MKHRTMREIQEEADRNARFVAQSQPWLVRVIFGRLTPPTMEIAESRVQLAEREERRATLERDLSGKDAQDCMDRVRRRMTHGDSEWIPPMYNRTKLRRRWEKRHRKPNDHSTIARIG